MQDVEYKALINRSKYIEYQICKWYKENVDQKTKMAIPSTKAYDIVCPAVENIEVKEDRLADKTDNYAFEMEDQTGLPSGLACTTAGEFVLVDSTHVIRGKTTSFLFLIRECERKKMIQMGYTTLEGKRAWGYLLPVSTVLSSPYVDVMARWFK
jgi:hypothetical protein